MLFDILINSQNKNKTNYAIDINITDIFQYAQIISPYIPASRQLVHDGNNCLTLVDYAGNEHDVVIENGYYEHDPYTLCTIINNGLEDITCQTVFFEFNKNNQMFVIKSDRSFSFNWKKNNNLLILMGFVEEYLLPNIDYKCGHFVLRSRVKHKINKTFVKLLIPEISNSEICLVINNDHYICPKIPINTTCDHITILFLDEDNNEYDFNGADHYFILRLFM